MHRGLYRAGSARTASGWVRTSRRRRTPGRQYRSRAGRLTRLKVRGAWVLPYRNAGILGAGRYAATFRPPAATAPSPERVQRRSRAAGLFCRRRGNGRPVGITEYPVAVAKLGDRAEETT